jgi:hypothetical protein
MANKCCKCRKDATCMVQTVVTGWGIGRAEFEFRCDDHRLTSSQDKDPVIMTRSQLRDR